MYASEPGTCPDDYNLDSGIATRQRPSAPPAAAIDSPCDVAEGMDQVDPRELTVLALVELLLKDRWQLHRILRVPAAPPILLPRLLAISLVGFILFGVTMSLLLTVAGRWPSLTTIAVWLEGPAAVPLSFGVIDSPGGNVAPWISGEVLVLVGAYAFGLVAASGVCLPSLYFYCLLAGVRMTMLDVVAHAVRSKAVAAVTLVGILPIYVALAMGVVIFDAGDFHLETTLLLGLVLPFIAGFWGTASLYQGFSQVCDTMPPDRAARRECFLRRLVLSWSAWCCRSLRASGAPFRFIRASQKSVTPCRRIVRRAESASSDDWCSHGRPAIRRSCR